MSVIEQARSLGRDRAVVTSWRDRRKYLWLLGLVAPMLVVLSWLAVVATGYGIFWWSGPIITFAVIPALDHFVGADADNPPDSALAWLENDRFYRWATYLYLPLQYVSLVLACWLWSGGGGVTMTVTDKLGLMITAGGIGGIAISAAHELGHKRKVAERRLSKLSLAQAWYGHFFVAHNRGHHVHVATPSDPASSRLGESLYGFIPRSAYGNLRTAWSLEKRRLARKGKSPWTVGNHVLNAWMMSAGVFVSLGVLFGVTVVPWMAGQAIVGICLLEAVNYIEHYGLRRRQLPDGRFERVRPSHSWNTSTVVGNLFLFQLQRHSDHHTHPLRRYQALRHADDAPQLPAGYPSMLLLAAFPPLWRRVMDRRVIDHYGGDVRLAALHPRRERRLLRA